MTQAQLSFAHEKAQEGSRQLARCPNQSKLASIRPCDLYTKSRNVREHILPTFLRSHDLAAHRLVVERVVNTRTCATHDVGTLSLMPPCVSAKHDLRHRFRHRHLRQNLSSATSSPFICRLFSFSVITILPLEAFYHHSPATAYSKPYPRTS